jgi:hypothetical protein
MRKSSKRTAITDKERISFMLRIGAIGGEWFDPSMQDFPDSWDSSVVRIVVDEAIRADIFEATYEPEAPR